MNMSPKTTFVIDWKERFPLLVPPNPQDLDNRSYSVFTAFEARIRPRRSVPFLKQTAATPVFFKCCCKAKSARLHEWIVEQLERTPWLWCSLVNAHKVFVLVIIGCEDVWPEEKGGAGSGKAYTYVGHYDEFGLLIHEKAPEPARMRWLTTLRQDEFPVKSCAELSTEMELFVKALRRQRKRAPYKLVV